MRKGRMGRQSLLQVSSLRLANFPASASFQFHLTSTPKLGGIKIDLDRSVPRQVAFDELKRDLIEKYGKPANEDTTTTLVFDKIAVVRVALWVVGSTSITLQRFEFPEYGGVSVWYEEKRASNL
jgi:hypothetical protein